ncbi:MAG: hypothetical protein KJ850_11190 [Gammaproteobacteria bacterium]|nr:hypothetical protein [Gammaproteobacteria bacterium]MBU1625594.1 hypothetical protein [Gammaproteobacteria bacterium]MBU1980854.1 hypothetical protein [Gammaproteobacteria bacterium]
MAINPVDSSSNYVSQVQPQPQSREEREVVKEQDIAAKAVAAQATQEPKPTVNTQGQTVGSVINVQA